MTVASALMSLVPSLLASTSQCSVWKLFHRSVPWEKFWSARPFLSPLGRSSICHQLSFGTG
uniref:Secreted protein n=1 Tax=Anguilla anguilla TaxID=7936 RepID=A0A0E9WTW8_ANGAN